MGALRDRVPRIFSLVNGHEYRRIFYHWYERALRLKICLLLLLLFGFLTPVLFSTGFKCWLLAT